MAVLLPSTAPVIREDFIPAGHPNRPGLMLERVDGLVLHYTANYSSTAGDEMHRGYVGRPYDWGCYWYRDPKVKDEAKAWTKQMGYIEDGSMGKGIHPAGQAGLGVPFRKASAQLFVDHDSVTWVIPDNEVAWACGDRQLPYDNGYKGQTKVAAEYFQHRQNYRTISLEICVNQDLPATLQNTLWMVRQIMKEHGLTMDQLFRHYDITGKVCPAFWVKDGPWQDFRKDVAKALAA